MEPNTSRKEWGYSKGARLNSQVIFSQPNFCHLSWVCVGIYVTNWCRAHPNLSRSSYMVGYLNLKQFFREVLKNWIQNLILSYPFLSVLVPYVFLMIFNWPPWCMTKMSCCRITPGGGELKPSLLATCISWCNCWVPFFLFVGSK